MSRIFISGSSTGLGLMTAELLSSQGHNVVIHARNANRAEDALRSLPAAEAVVIGDLETIAGTTSVAAQVNALGRFDAVIHNARTAHHRRWFAARLRRQHVVALPTHRADRASYTSRLSQLRHASSRGCQPGRHPLEDAPLEWIVRLCRKQTPRHNTCLRCCPALDGCSFECVRARLGADQDGRTWCARRHGPSAHHAGLARGERRS
jgi:nucleoside-diphosphate-sugar epimerase